ncbi:MAG: DotU family type IV/VI secretion system protein [Myxococcota bacterium]|nr:DotU family type IV/VI secretion system protein [Myxococcota bacterium]
MSADTRDLWFAIEQTISKIDELCVRAKAEELRAMNRQNEGSWLPNADTNGFAPSEQDEAATSPEPWGGRTKGADIVTLRAALREHLQLLRDLLSRRLTEREVYYCLFPIVIYTDELVHAAVGQRSRTWAPLQQELYDVDNGGEMFYSLIDNLLAKSETLPLIFEVFYFCIRDGFVGALDNNPARIQEYLDRLKLRIPTMDVSPAGSDEIGFDESVELIDFPKSYYAMAAGVLLGFFVVLQMFARY